MTEQIDWEHIRTNWSSKTSPPPHWKSGVKPISMEGLSLLGIHEKTGELHWDGHEIPLRKRISLGAVERWSIIAASSATLGLFVLEAIKFWMAP